MSVLGHLVPSSLRKPVQSAEAVRFAPAQPMRPMLAAAEARAMSTVKAAPACLACEPEDARLTGVTRSLHRRLLALNLRVAVQDDRFEARIA